MRSPTDPSAFSLKAGNRNPGWPRQSEPTDSQRISVAATVNSNAALITPPAHTSNIASPYAHQAAFLPPTIRPDDNAPTNNARSNYRPASPIQRRESSSRYSSNAIPAIADTATTTWHLQNNCNSSNGRPISESISPVDSSNESVYQDKYNRLRQRLREVLEDNARMVSQLEDAKSQIKRLSKEKDTLLDRLLHSVDRDGAGYAMSSSTNSLSPSMSFTSNEGSNGYGRADPHGASDMVPPQQQQQQMYRNGRPDASHLVPASGGRPSLNLPGIAHTKETVPPPYASSARQPSSSYFQGPHQMPQHAQMHLPPMPTSATQPQFPRSNQPPSGGYAAQRSLGPAGQSYYRSYHSDSSSSPRRMDAMSTASDHMMHVDRPPMHQQHAVAGGYPPDNHGHYGYAETGGASRIHGSIGSHPAPLTPTTPSSYTPPRSGYPGTAIFDASSSMQHAGANMPRPGGKRRKRHHDISSKVRSVQPVPRDKDGNYELPVQVGILTVLSLGAIVWDRETYHNERYIWPVGYTVQREYYSMIDPNKQVIYTCRITDGGDGPRFHVEPEDIPGSPIIANTATGAWTTVLRTVNQIRHREHSNSASGPDYFGFSHPTIAKMIQDLPGADKCRTYVMQRFVEMKDRHVRGVIKKGRGGRPSQDMLSRGQRALLVTSGTRIGDLDSSSRTSDRNMDTNSHDEDDHDMHGDMHESEFSLSAKPMSVATLTSGYHPER